MFPFSLFKAAPRKPTSEHLFALSTPHGIMQHTMYNFPDPEHGYATDDNARALVVAHLWKAEHQKNEEALRNLESYFLRALKFTQDESGQFYARISFDLKKTELGTGDWFGRALFALSFLSFYSTEYSNVAMKIIFKSLSTMLNKEFSIRTTSFLILASFYFFKKNERDKIILKREKKNYYNCLKKWGIFLKKAAKENFGKNWNWPGEKITYDNGKVIQAYLILGTLLGDEALINTGKTILDFYIKETFKNGYFQAPGNRGFWEKNKKKPLYDEQAVEAYSMTAALVTAYEIFNDRKYLSLANDAYMWFWGKNRLNKSLVDTGSGAVYDGLRRENINDNQGAESYLSLNLAYFALTKKIII